MNNIGILLIDSDAVQVSGLKDFLSKHGYSAIYIANTAGDGLLTARKLKPEIIIVEVDFPDKDGIFLCAELRATDSLQKSYIIVCSFKNENFIKIAALNSGADDYLVKPLNHFFFLSKLKAWHRRLTFSSDKKEGKDTELFIDNEKHIVVVKGKEIELPRKEFEILSLLFNHPRKVFTRKEIKSAAWQINSNVKSRTIDVHIKKLREKIGDSFIKTIKGVGYKLDR